MVPNSEQTMLRDAAEGWVREHAPVGALRALRARTDDAGFDPALHAGMAEMGWAGVAVPEADGGYGFGFMGLGLLAEQLGRNLVASPLLGTAAVADALVLAGTDEQKAKWLPKLVSGEVHAALAIDEGRRHDPSALAMRAWRDGQTWELNGHKRPVCEGNGAGLLLVATLTDNGSGVTLFLCPGGVEGLEHTVLSQIDSRGATAAHFSQVHIAHGAVLGEPGEGAALLDQVLDRARVVLAAEMLGSAQQAFDTTVEYLKTRVQFDKPIGSFQALQHRAADMLGDLELTRSAVRAALAAIDAGDTDLPRLASLAKALAGQTFRRLAQEMVQLHGGIGMTDEHDAGLYLKRSQVADVLLGNVAFHRSRYAQLSGI